MPFKRVFLIIVDSFGIGEEPDAAAYDDVGSDSMGHIDEVCGPLKMPNMARHGLFQLHTPLKTPADPNPIGVFARLQEASVGKDTTTGHWEMMGVKHDHPFITFTDTGFPDDLIKELEEKTGHAVIGNKAASGTTILDELAQEELDSHSRKIIVYTSADSVLQICGSEESMGLDELYRVCEIARDITMKDEWKVGRVIARPYVGNKETGFTRTPNRRDYSVKPPHKTDLNAMQEAGLDVIGIGKIHDIFDGEGITETLHSNSSIHGMQQTMEVMDRDFRGLCFVNLVDFDAKWGHRRNPQGYAKELESFDELLGQMEQKLRDDDLVIIAADHGNDPTFKGTDHTREQVPFLAFSKTMNKGIHLPDQTSFAQIGATICDNFNVIRPEKSIGTSLLEEIESAKA